METGRWSQLNMYIHMYLQTALQVADNYFLCGVALYWSSSDCIWHSRQPMSAQVRRISTGGPQS